MNKISKPIIFFGTDNFSLNSLKKLVEAGYRVEAVITKPDSKQGRGQKIVLSPVKTFAISIGIQVYQPNNLSSLTDFFKLIDSPLGILSSYGKIIPETTISLFSPGIINVHPSLLPKYRGASPIESAILNGDPTTGVSIMKLSPGLDDGPIYAQESLALNGTETSLSLAEDLANIGTQLLLKILPKIIDNTLAPIPQNHNNASFTERLTKQESLLDPSKLTAKQAEQRVRAYLSYPKTKVKFDKLQPIIILKSHASDHPSGTLDILCKDGNYLVIDELISPSGRKMLALDFKNGYLRSA